MQIFIKDLINDIATIFIIEVDADDTIYVVKQKIQEKKLSI